VANTIAGPSGGGSIVRSCRPAYSAGLQNQSDRTSYRIVGIRLRQGDGEDSVAHLFITIAEDDPVGFDVGDAI
jgi:hypothetical protein